MDTFSIIGAGNMARGIATRALAGGNTVQILARDLDEANALARDLDGDVAVAAIDGPVQGDVVILALPYDGALAVVRQLGDALAGKVVVDITNPVNVETFDGLVTPPASSGAEEIAKVAPPGAQVVKAFNTTFASTVIAGQVEGRPLDVLIAGDDADAKAAVAALVEDGGMRPLDVGPLSRAHWLEGLGFLHIGLQATRGTGYDTAIKLIG